MIARVALLLSLAALAAAVAFAYLKLEGEGGQRAVVLARQVADRVKVPVPVRFGPPRVMRTVYLNREGARLRGGPDDAQINQSSIVAHAGLAEVSVPAFSGSHARWKAIVKCVAGVLSPFDVQVVDQRPVGEDYMMVMMGGSVGVLGAFGKQQHHALGLSPYNGKPIEDAIVLVFTRTAKEATRKVCDTAGMEIGHAFGLDHARNCRDLMTYLPACGAKRFMDKELACGESKDRVCGNGAQTQNSHAHLLGLLGPRPVAQAR